MKHLERLSTILVLFVASMLAWRLVTDRLTTANSHQRLSAPYTGQALGLPDIRYGNKATLVLALSTRCHFCQQSTPFYQKLTKISSRAGDALKIVAILPQDEASSSRYLSQQGIVVDRIVSGSLGAISVGATPTVILLDAKRKVLKSWAGLMNGSRESEVLVAIHGLCQDCSTI